MPRTAIPRQLGAFDMQQGASGAGGGAFGNVLGNAIGGLFGLQGQLGGNARLTDFADQMQTTRAGNIGGPGFDLTFNDQGANIGLSPQQAAIRAGQEGNIAAALQGQGLQSQLFGGFMQNPAVALQDQALANTQFQDPSQINNLAGGAAGAAGQALNRFGQGPQDLTGGLQNQLFQGGANLLGQTDFSQLQQQNLDQLRQQAQPFETQQINQLGSALFGSGRRATTGGQTDANFFAQALGQADLGRQTAATSLAQQQQAQNAALGAQQVGLGSGLLGQNLGAFNQFANQAQGFTGLAGGLAGQQFGQGLTTQNVGLSRGQQRLQNAMQQFGLQSGSAAQDTAAAQGFLGQIQQGDLGRAGLVPGALNAETNRNQVLLQSQLAAAQAQAQSGGLLGNVIGGGISGFLGGGPGGGIGGALSGLFGG